jgi:hypothetical protein
VEDCVVPHCVVSPVRQRQPVHVLNRDLDGVVIRVDLDRERPFRETEPDGYQLTSLLVGHMPGPGKGTQARRPGHFDAHIPIER